MEESSEGQQGILNINEVQELLVRKVDGIGESSIPLLQQLAEKYIQANDLPMKKGKDYLFVICQIVIDVERSLPKDFRRGRTPNNQAYRSKIREILGEGAGFRTAPYSIPLKAFRRFSGEIPSQIQASKEENLNAQKMAKNVENELMIKREKYK